MWLVSIVPLFLWQKYILSKVLYIGLVFALLFIAIFPVGDWLLYPLEKTYPVNPRLERVDGIIVLAGPEDPNLTDYWDQVAIHEGAERNLMFMALARRFPNSKLVFTGGSGSIFNQDMKAADVAERLFYEQGLNISRIRFERESRNTYENALLSKQLVGPVVGESWVLITTAWHMRRAVGVFCSLDWEVVPYPVDFHTTLDGLFRVEWSLGGTIVAISTGLKEWIGLFTYRLTGKSC